MSRPRQSRVNRRATYNDIGGPTGHLANFEEFEGNSMSAMWLTGYDGLTYYTVFSYNTAIARFRPSDHTDRENGRDLYGLLWLTDREYSVTTSHHKGLVRAWLGYGTPDLRDITPTDHYYALA